MNEEAGGAVPRRDYGLPPRDDPAFDDAAAGALLGAARAGETEAAERATGDSWGESRLRPHVERRFAAADASGDERLAQLARRFLRSLPRARAQQRKPAGIFA